MKIVQITAGSGGTFYCENCLRDAWLIKALRRQGHDAIMAPLYLPLEIDGTPEICEGPLFFGGLNTYLQQRFALFRRTPRWFDRVLDRPKMLLRMARKARMTRAIDLGAMTVSMLRGVRGFQSKEVRRLADWLAVEKPDAVILANALLTGLAPAIKAASRTKVLCLVQDEDAWLDALPAPYQAEAWDALADSAAHIDTFVAVSRYYADIMAQRMCLPSTRMRAVYPGIPLEGFSGDGETASPAIGYLARMTPAMGLDILLDAFHLLLQQPTWKSLQLKIAGGRTSDDAAYIASLQRRIAQAGTDRHITILSELDRPSRQAFLSTLTVLAAPTRDKMAFGIFALEALAAGVPVVLPRHGAFPEVIELTGGGVLYEPNNPEALAAAIADLLSNPVRRSQLGQAGQKAVRERFNIDRMASDLIVLCGER